MQCKRRRDDYAQRKQRVIKHQEKIELLRALMLTHEQRGDKAAAVKINVRIRTLQQQVRYIGVDPAEPLIQ